MSFLTVSNPALTAHSTALREFLKREHTGNETICYGYAYKFTSDDELKVFIGELNNL